MTAQKTIKISDYYLKKEALSSIINNAEDKAATPKAVQSAYNIANSKPDLGTDHNSAAYGDHTHDYSNTYAALTHTSVKGDENVFGHAKAFSGTTTTIAPNANNGTDSSVYARGDHVHTLPTFSLVDTKNGSNIKAWVYSNGFDVFVKIANYGSTATSLGANASKLLFTIEPEYAPFSNVYSIGRASSDKDMIIGISSAGENIGKVTIFNRTSSTTVDDINCSFYYPLKSRMPE